MTVADLLNASLRNLEEWSRETYAAAYAQASSRASAIEMRRRTDGSWEPDPPPKVYCPRCGRNYPRGRHSLERCAELRPNPGFVLPPQWV